MIGDGARVPIPARLEGRPVSGGLAHPWVNVALADGGVDYRSPHHARWERAWRDMLCQACGQPHGTRLVFLAGPNQLMRLVFDEPPLHPECAAYAQDACPMVAGARTHYADRPRVAHGARGRTCPEPGCDCGGWRPHPGTDTAAGGDPAHPWYAIWAAAYTLAFRPDGRLFGGGIAPHQVLGVRLVSLPGQGRCPSTLTPSDMASLVRDPAIASQPRPGAWWT